MELIEVLNICDSVCYAVCHINDDKVNHYSRHFVLTAQSSAINTSNDSCNWSVFIILKQCC